MRGRKPIREQMLTPAEKCARFRAAHADGAPRIRYRKPADRRGKAQRWRDAVGQLVELQEEYRAWLEALPESLQESATTDALRATCGGLIERSGRAANALVALGVEPGDRVAMQVDKSADAIVLALACLRRSCQFRAPQAPAAPCAGRRAIVFQVSLGGVGLRPVC